MTIFPILILGILIVIFSSGTFTKSMQTEVRSGLKNLAISVLNTYDVAYPGDYALQLQGEKALQLIKGNQVISGKYDIIDKIKKETGIDITIFYQDTRVLTTIEDEDGTRIIATAAHPMILREVYDQKQEKFYNNASIGSDEYFAYYAPLYNEDGTCVGMIAAAKPADNVNAMIHRSVYLIFVLAVAAMVLTSLVSIGFTRRIVDIIQEIKSFLSSVEKGNLTSKLDDKVLNRPDEFGEMGRSILHMQKALRILIEQDALTKLYNRRSGERKTKAIYERAKKTGAPFSVSIGDIDFFKKVNDTYGHEAGDAILKSVAKILNQNMVGRGFAARWGGEEFLLVYENATQKVAAEALNDILGHIRSTEVDYQDQKIKVTMTFGVVEGDCNKEINVILKEADDKLYAGKSSGRNCVMD
ncbi:MAG: sensor domain-containing diguanylate cyclase [Lachnospiraceae bacterium]|nr:sensor domain-containing diguanylate cyclase [Lachnospiraceae bacterium]